MKAKVKETGEIVNVDAWFNPEHGEFICYGSPKDNTQYSKYELSFDIGCPEGDIGSEHGDWHSTLIQLTSAALTGLCANITMSRIDEEKIAFLAVKQAQEVIKKLKEVKL